MATFVRRTQAPETSNTYYYANNPFYQVGYGMPNCTCYAYGRFWEIMGGSKPSLSLGNAENWWGNTKDGYKRGQTPRLGAVICWRLGEAGNANDGAGHVEVVEAVNADGSIVTTGSAWQGFMFREKTRTNNDGNWNGGAYVFQGFIYNPATEDSGSTSEKLTPISGNRYLTRAEMQVNARYIWKYLGARGWTLNAVAGMLGNMESESTINPGIWQNLNVNVGPAFGLVQWDPYTKYTDWCAERGLDPAHMDSALMRIEWELANGGQYYATPSYPETFAQFKVSTKSANYLGMAFLANYERPRNPNQPERGTQAEYWYTYLLNNPVDPDTPGDPGDTPGGVWNPKKKMSLLLLIASIKRK